MIYSAASQGGVVSDEFVAKAFATENGPPSSTALMISNLFPLGAKLTSTGEVILWGCLDDPMSLREKARMPHPQEGGEEYLWGIRGTFSQT
jgi:hypothetical protein